MAREINRLSARKVQTVTEPGRHADGGGLYLVVDPSGAKRWVMLYRFEGKRREMGLGSTLAVSLAAAREKAADARSKIDRRLDPLTERAARTSAPPVTFGDVANEFMSDRETLWHNAVHRRQWRQTLEVQSAQVWNKAVADVTTDDVLAVLRPIWHTKSETARRMRGRMERILDAAKAKGYRPGLENPARWRGHLEMILPRTAKLQFGHHAAMPYVDVPDFYARLCDMVGPVPGPLRFVILTAARAGEVRGMTWGEVDLAAALWTVPAARMKAKRIHRVPLSGEALGVLRSYRPKNPMASDLVFTSISGRMFSDMAFNMFLRRAGYDVTTHGFRSSFRDWVDAETSFPGDLAEVALAHLVGDATERAYRRGDALEKRRQLMDSWAGFCSTRSSSE